MNEQQIREYLMRNLTLDINSYTNHGMYGDSVTVSVSIGLKSAEHDWPDEIVSASTDFRIERGE